MDKGSKRFDQSQGWFTDLSIISSCLTRSEGFNADTDKVLCVCVCACGRARACVCVSVQGGSAPRPACSQGTLLFMFAVCIWGTKCLSCWQIDVQIAVMSGTWAVRCQKNCHNLKWGSNMFPINRDSVWEEIGGCCYDLPTAYSSYAHIRTRYN